MKNYTITVNGIAYDVTVEENTANTVSPAPIAKTPVASAPKTEAPKAAPAPKTAAPAQAGGQGSLKINAPMPGKILAVKVSSGQAVKKGEVVLILEAMKMENEIVAPEAGTVASINVAVGDMIEAGVLLATLN
jgi:biotin carboxyl carrier protein